MNPAQKQGKHALMTQAESRGQGADPRVEDFVRVGAIRGDTYYCTSRYYRVAGS